MTNLRSTQPHFVRCIIPNETKTPGMGQLGQQPGSAPGDSHTWELAGILAPTLSPTLFMLPLSPDPISVLELL